MIAGQQRCAEREIARYLASPGGLFTDDMELEMMRRMWGHARRAVCGGWRSQLSSQIGFKPHQSGTGSSCCGPTAREYT